MSPHSISFHISATKDTPALTLTNPSVKGLIHEFVPIDIGPVVFKSRGENQVMRLEFDLLSEIKCFHSLIEWFEQVRLGPADPVELRRKVQVTVEVAGQVMSHAELTGVLPVRWETTSFDNAGSPRALFYFAYDNIDLNTAAGPRPNVTRAPAVKIPALDGVGGENHTQSLVKENSVGAEFHLQVDSCAGLEQCLTVERIWTVNTRSLIHSIDPKTARTRIKFYIKSNSQNQSSIQSLMAWHRDVAKSGRAESWNLNYTFVLGAKGSRISFRLKNCVPLALELRDLSASSDPVIALEILAEQIQSGDQILAAKGSAAPTSLAFGTVILDNMPDFLSHTMFRGQCSALVLLPRYIVPGLSRSLRRSDIEMAPDNNLVLPTHLSEHLKQNHQDHNALEMDDPPDLMDLAFYVYSNNPWSGHQTAKYDLRLHLENFLMPLFYAYRESGTFNQDVSLQESLDFHVDGGINWRSLDEDLGLPQRLCGKATTGKRYSATMAKSAVSIPLVIGMSQSAEPFAPEPVTGTMTRCQYEIDQWHSCGRPARAKVHMTLRRYRGLQCTNSQLQDVLRSIGRRLA